MLDKGVSPESHEMRTVLARHLEEAQELLQRSLSDIDLDGFLADLPKVVTPDDVDARYPYGLIMRKMGFHILAILLANRQNNVHSAGVQARVIVECAAEIVPLGNVACEGTSGALERVLNVQEYEGNYFLLRMSRGSITKEELESHVTAAREAIGLFDGKQPTKVSLTDRVAVLTQGKQWYAYLSDGFCHTDADRLREVPGLGGALPAPETQFDVALITIMNCAVTYICQSLMAYGIIRITAGDGSQYFDDALALFGRVRESTAPFRETLTLAPRSTDQ